MSIKIENIILYFIWNFFLRTVLNSDYSSVSPLNVTFLAGSTSSGDSACTVIRIIDDDALEGAHSFTVRLYAVELSGGLNAGLSIEEPNSASVNIADNEGTVLT